jgi:peptidoglycan/xylan/chitin deacetylase (PgdA/CDA1 family)
MPTWIFSLPKLSRLLVAVVLAVALSSGAVRADIVTRLPTDQKVVALTFDACETKTPAFLDTKIETFLVENHIPFTIFVSGRFARHNATALAELAHRDFVEIENHSLNHDNHMDRLDNQAIQKEVVDNDTLLAGITGQHTRFFRFPAGNSSPEALKEVEDLGYRVVHWSFASGDPAKDVTAGELTRWVLAKTRPGSILIFHINGRGWSTGDALPSIVADLTKQGYAFTRLDQALP